GPRHVVEVGRRRHHRLVDLGELFFGATAFDADDVAQVFVARRHCGIDSEEATEINLTVGFNLQVLEGDSAHCALRHVPNHYAGVERANPVSLRFGKWFRPAYSARSFDVDRERTRPPFSADSKVLDLRTAPRLALPGRGDPPVCFAFCGVPPDAVDQGKQVVD